MADPSIVYSFGYNLTKSGGVFTLVDANPGASGVNPVASGITVIDSVDPDGSMTAGDKFKVDVASGSLSSNGGKYDFYGTATIGGSDGIIVKKDGDFYFLTDTAYSGNLNGHHGQVAVNDVDTNATIVVCFMAGTMIRTPNGEAVIETLQRGDLVCTQDGRTVPVDWLGRQTVSLMFADKLRVLPIRIKAGALADNVPARDLLVSPDHALLVGGALIQAGALVNGTSIVRVTNVPQTFTYYHIEVADHSLILAENTPAETFVDNVDRLGFDNWAEHEALYPEGKSVAELPYPRAKSSRQVPVSIRVMLGDRAQVIGAVTDQAAVA